MAKLTPDATRTEHGLVINEKIIPWGAKWPKSWGSYDKGDTFKADRLLSDGTGKVGGVTIHNTNDLDGVSDDAEQYTRATWPNANMGDARVHYYTDELGAWQNLREDEVGWHAGDGRGDGNDTTLSIEIIMVGDGRAEDKKAEENGILLAAILLHRHGLGIDKLYTHNHWMGHPDRIVQGARKNCPLYILPHWADFKAKVAAKLAELNGSSGTVETVTEGKTAIMGEAKATAYQMAQFCLKKNASPKLPYCTVAELAEIFLEEGKAEGVRGDVAWAQSLHETGYFKFGGIVLPDQNNYGGIGALNGNSQGQAATFPDPRTGVRAQIQHLKAYASTEALVNVCIDPRFSLVTRGVASFVEWLGASDNPKGKGWAYPGAGYGASITALLDNILKMEGGSSPVDSQEPTSVKYKEGDIVQFCKSPHYKSANAKDYSSIPASGPAKITAYVEGAAHPYHVIHTDASSTVYGWVDETALAPLQNTTPAYTIYTVVKNDTLWDIAEEWLGTGTRYPEIKELSGLKSNTIFVGQKLKIPVA